MDPKQEQKIYADLEGLAIDLPRDPSSLGADYLREQISICRGYLNTVSLHLQRILQEKSILDRDLEGKETAFEIASDDLMATDGRVKNLPAIEDRQAMINVLLAPERRAIKALQSSLRHLGNVEKVVRFRLKELDNTMSAIRLQRSLLSDQLRTGAFYGNENIKPDPVDEMATEDLSSLIDEAEAELAGTKDSAVQFNDEEDEEEDEETKESVAPAVSKPASPAPAPKSEEAEMLDELETLMNEEDEDSTELVAPAPKPSKSKAAPVVQAAKPSKTTSSESKNPEPVKKQAKSADIDPEMQRFLEEPDEDDIEHLLADI